MEFDVEKHKIFECISGSHAYGTNDEFSDTDYRGVLVAPKRYYIGMNKIEQYRDPKQDRTIYEIQKFLTLCLACNPNILELLFIPDDCVIYTSKWWELIKENRNLFLTARCKFTYSGYAVSQLHRIKLHRGWLLNPAVKKPERSDYGLSNDKVIDSSDLGAANKLVNSGFVIGKEAMNCIKMENKY